MTTNATKADAPRLSGRELRDELIRNLVAKVEENNPQSLPWRGNALLLPQINGVSKRPYRGINRLFAAERINDLGGSLDRRWFTFTQVRAMQTASTEQNAPFSELPHVRKGERATQVVFARRVETGTKSRSKDREQSVSETLQEQSIQAQATKSYFCLRKYGIFHASQIENCPPADDLPRFQASDVTRDAHDALVDAAKRMGVSLITNPSQVPNYAPGKHRMSMPAVAQFTTEQRYLSTLAHELAHATGDVGRLERDAVAKLQEHITTIGATNPDQMQAIRAQEEMTAEIAACLMCAALGFRYELDDDEYGQQHSQYIAGWKKAIHDNPTALAVATAHAERILNYIVETSPVFRLRAEETGFALDLMERQSVAQNAAAQPSADAIISVDGVDLDPDLELALEGISFDGVVGDVASTQPPPVAVSRDPLGLGF